ALAAECQIDDHAAMTGERMEFSAGQGIPDLHLFIIACRHEVPAIWMEGHAADPFTVAAQGHDFLALRIAWRGGVPEMHGLVQGHRYQPRPVRAKGHRSYPIATVAAESQDFLTGHRIPELHGSIVPRGGQAPAVGTESHAQDQRSVPAEGQDLLAG